MSYIIEKKVTPLRCHRCLHKWNYSGNNSYVATCPHCRTYVNIRKGIVRYKEIVTQYNSKFHTNEKNSDSFDNINSKTESNESFSS